MDAIGQRTRSQRQSGRTTGTHTQKRNGACRYKTLARAHTDVWHGMSVHGRHSCCCQGKQQHQPRRGGRHDRREAARPQCGEARAIASPLRRARGSAGQVWERRRRCARASDGAGRGGKAASTGESHSAAAVEGKRRRGASEGRGTGQGHSARYEEGGSASGRPPCASVGGARRGARPSDEGGSDRWDAVDDGRVQRSPRAEHRPQCRRSGKRVGGRESTAVELR